ncbi:MAG: hypothetical protein JSU94_08415 [Phycisphaerales bacterium]|nr:MAG: hypothetical protein JSU94_08415 [Phycisphaerales bacterium]
MLKLTKEDLSDVSVVALIAANALPLYGVAFLKWNAAAIVLLYWAENLVVGFYNILKIALAPVKEPVEHLGKLFVIPFFMVHYGGFMAVHGVFVLAFFAKSEPKFPGSGGAPTWPCFLVFLQLLLGVIRQAWAALPPGTKPILLMLFASHGVSFVHNFLLKREYESTDPGKLMAAPYTRIVVMHVAIIFGAFISVALKSPLGILVILVVLKTVIDVKLHLHSHKKLSPSAKKA